MGKTVDATYDQDRFAQVNNDAADESASLGTTNASFSKAPSTTFRVRFCIQQTASAATGNLSITPTLYYSYNSGAYTEVGNPTDTDAPVRVVADANVTDNATTTLRLGSGDSNVAGRLEDSAPGATAVTFSNPSTGEATEYEWALEVYEGYAGLANSDTIVLRVYNSTTALDTYTNSPTVTVTGIADALLANDVESASQVSNPALGQVHALLANDVESASSVTAPALAEVVPLLANDVESASEVSSPAIGQTHALLADDVQSASSVGAPTLGQTHALLANDVESAGEVSSPAVGQVHALTANDVESASEVTAPTLAAAGGTDALLANDVESSSEVSTPTLGQVHVLTANSVESASEVSAPTLAESSGVLDRIRGGGGRRERTDDDEVVNLVLAFLKHVA